MQGFLLLLLFLQLCNGGLVLRSSPLDTHLHGVPKLPVGRSQTVRAVVVRAPHNQHRGEEFEKAESINVDNGVSLLALDLQQDRAHWFYAFVFAGFSVLLAAMKTAWKKLVTREAENERLLKESGPTTQLKMSMLSVKGAHEDEIVELNKQQDLETSLFEGFSREVFKFFNPTTNGAKIAGRCPDTQTLETEVDRLNKLETAIDLREDFNSDRFAIELARRASETSMVEDNWDAAFAQVLNESSGNTNGNELGVETECAVDDFEDEEVVEIDDENGEALTGRELALLCYSKYGKFHDMAIKHVRMGGGMKRWVSLNLYVGHLAQRSYPSTEKEYIERLDAIAFMITRWNQAGYCRRWFAEKPIARRGLPSRPRVDTCVTLQFSRSPTWDDELVDDFFGY